MLKEIYKSVFVLLLFVLTSATMVNAAEINLQKIKVATKDSLDKKENFFLEGIVPFKSTNGKSFQFTFDAEFIKYWYYGKIIVGVKNSKNDYKIDFSWSKGDNGKRHCSVKAELMDKFKFTHKKFIFEKSENKYHFTIAYLAPTRSVSWKIKDQNNKKVYDSGWKKIREDLSFDQFFIATHGGKKGRKDNITKITFDDNVIEATSNVINPSYVNQSNVSNVSITTQ